MSKDNKKELSSAIMIDFGKLAKIKGQNVIPVVVQDVLTKEVLILAYVNQKALERTLESGIATFWSTSRNKLWIKGEEESGNFLKIVEVRINCDQNSLLYLIQMAGGGACHVKDDNGNYRRSCYYRRINPKTKKLEFV